MLIAQVHKSLVSVSEKSFVSTFPQSQHKPKNNNNSFPWQLCLNLYLFWLTQVCIFNFDFLFYLQTHDTIVNWLSEGRLYHRNLQC